ncbi:MAG TPA: hypothetical protein VGP72_18695 [Planctomycetota bacterium]|jgi:hypothetical protein
MRKKDDEAIWKAVKAAKAKGADDFTLLHLAREKGFRFTNLKRFFNWRDRMLIKYPEDAKKPASLPQPTIRVWPPR